VQARGLEFVPDQPEAEKQNPDVIFRRRGVEVAALAKQAGDSGLCACSCLWYDHRFDASLALLGEGSRRQR
jgi:hypothetical protein